jgi:hypothetical protein
MQRPAFPAMCEIARSERAAPRNARCCLRIGEKRKRFATRVRNGRYATESTSFLGCAETGTAFAFALNREAKTADEGTRLGGF